ncbi:MAG: META domain-containing protein [Bacteroides sp.]|nr:META domain-containing protein [Bacteroides sp.]MCM1458458.1 META domain-containing protein [Lachnoclostridium sp.]
MKKTALIPLFAGLMLASCAGSASSDSNSADTSADSTCTVCLNGKWAIESIVLNDSSAVIPADLGLADEAAMTFSCDSTVSISTGCNTMGGMYIINGDSIRFDNMMQTRMACPNMDIEMALTNALPTIATVELANDSTARLNAPEAMPCINIRRISQPVKCQAE